jgi:hypothetical protein
VLFTIDAGFHRKSREKIDEGNDNIISGFNVLVFREKTDNKNVDEI